MAVPKKRVSTQRKRKRRTHYKAEAVPTRACPRCGEPRLAHRVCGGCGYYRNTSVLDVQLD